MPIACTAKVIAVVPTVGGVALVHLHSVFLLSVHSDQTGITAHTNSPVVSIEVLRVKTYATPAVPAVVTV